MVNLEKIKKKVKEIYKNYGINTSEMTDEEVQRLCEYYLTNKQALKEDLEKSLIYKGKYSDEDLI